MISENYKDISKSMPLPSSPTRKLIFLITLLGSWPRTAEVNERNVTVATLTK